MFSPDGPSLRELAVQALSSVERGYDMLAPKFDHTPFRTPDSVLDATTAALRALGPFRRGLDVCCGTGAGARVLEAVCEEPPAGADFSAGMLARARSARPGAAWVRADVRALPFAAGFDLAVTFGSLGHFVPAERPGLFAGVARALRPGGVLAFPAAVRPSRRSRQYWAMAGFDTAMRLRNAIWRPPFTMYYLICPLPSLRAELAAAGFTVSTMALQTPGDGPLGCQLIVARTS